MFVEDAHLRAIEPINALLEEKYGVRLGPGPVDHFESIREHYVARRDLIVRSMGHSQAIHNAEYQKAYLLAEGARIILREIQPKRRKKFGSTKK